MSPRLRDWRGNTTRFLEGESLIDQTATVERLMSKLCLVSGRDGSAKCRFLISAQSHWLTSILPIVESSINERNGDSHTLKTGVSQGRAIGVIFTATCRECKQRKMLSGTFLVESIPELLLKSLALRDTEGTFIMWRMEIGNTYRRGRSAMWR